ncbi:MAG: hypothetical protein KJ964_00145 [Verrucomicrobia bacterium]|nr:hypothetical protein [Verrucomicrobiota bacterium]MBU1733933.1 hypothetical protein [Verrucomicrobiota bacterium]MBU1857287.1 hypothetical protein [Verrucomicrobiota bacterium]
MDSSLIMEIVIISGKDGTGIASLPSSDHGAQAGEDDIWTVWERICE